jgi:pyruvate/2-oxoglutarate dehydrogenase complex dihydrolipoamide acyltransferase (E2) component
MPERTFVLPDLGEGLEEAELREWLVKEGDEVALNQPLVEVETAKATVEIPSPFAGIVAKLHAAAGDTVRVGAPIVTFDVEANGDETSEPEPAVSEKQVPPAMPATGEAHIPLATPPVRKLARDLGVDLSVVSGTGPNGRITNEDVERAARGDGAAEERPAGRALWTVMMPVDADVRPISMIRRTIAENLTRVVREVPQVTTFRTLDCTALEEFRHEAGLSPLPIVIRALADVCAEHRSLNASYMAEQGEIWLHRKVHVGVATDTERGLLVPVVRDAGTRTIGDIANAVARLAAAARNGSIRVDEMTGGTITVTNTGSYGSEFGTPILNRPQGAILGVGVIGPRALVVAEQVVARPACTLSLTFDHRLLDGATAGRAFGELVDILSSRERLEALPR